MSRYMCHWWCSQTRTTLTTYWEGDDQLPLVKGILVPRHAFIRHHLHSTWNKNVQHAYNAYICKVANDKNLQLVTANQLAHKLDYSQETCSTFPAPGVLNLDSNGMVVYITWVVQVLGKTIVSDTEREIRSAEKFQDQLGFEPKTFRQMLVPLSHWAHGRGAAHKLPVAALCGGLSMDSLSLSVAGPVNFLVITSLLHKDNCPYTEEQISLWLLAGILQPTPGINRTVHMYGTFKAWWAQCRRPGRVLESK